HDALPISLSKATGSTWSAGTNSVTSISWFCSTGRLASSSLVRITISPFSDSYALAISEYSTSSPLSSRTRRYRIRTPSALSTCRACRSWSSVAAYTLTGTFTRPKETSPFQMDRMGQVCATAPDVAAGPETPPADNAAEATWNAVVHARRCRSSAPARRGGVRRPGNRPAAGERDGGRPGRVADPRAPPRARRRSAADQPHDHRLGRPPGDHAAPRHRLASLSSARAPHRRGLGARSAPGRRGRPQLARSAHRSGPAGHAHHDGPRADPTGQRTPPGRGGRHGRGIPQHRGGRGRARHAGLRAGDRLDPAVLRGHAATDL